MHFLYTLLPSLHDCDLKPSKFMRPLYGVGEHNTKNFLLFFVNLDTVLWDFTQKFREHFTNWIKLNKINEVLNSAKWIFGLLSSRNFATMATWRNDLSSLLYIEKDEKVRSVHKGVVVGEIRLTICIPKSNAKFRHWISVGFGFGVSSERVGGGGALRTSSPYPTKTILQDNHYVTSRQPCWLSRTKAFLSSGNWTLFLCKFFAKKFYCFYAQYCRLVTWLQTKNTRDDHLKSVVRSLCLK